MNPARIFVSTSVSLAVALLAAGCSKGSGSGTAAASSSTNANAPKGGSCVQDKAGLCTEFSENPAGFAEGMCTSLLKGTYSKDACSRDNTVGSCQSKSDVTYYYFGNSSGPWTEDAADECKTIHDGTFTATPGAADMAKQKALPAPAQILASCVNDANSCDDYYGDPIKVDISKSLCDGAGKWNDGKACPTDGLIATCLSNGTAHRYYTGYPKKNGVSMNDLASLCKGSGIGYSHFYPAPGAPAATVVAGKGKKGK